MWPGSDPPSEPDNLLDAIHRLERQAGSLCRPAETHCNSDCCRALPDVGGRVVAVTLPDLIALATLLHRPRDKSELRAAVEELVRSHCTLSPFTGTYMLTGVAGHCPYLGDDGRCTVHATRPLLCRLFFHCGWVGKALQWDGGLDRRAVDLVLGLAQDMGRLWKGHAGLLWRAPWRYDLIPLGDGKGS